jgi:hypothetical protein
MKSSRNIAVSIVVVIAIARVIFGSIGPVIQRRMFLRTQTANRTSLRERRELRYRTWRRNAYPSTPLETPSAACGRNQS